MNYDCAADLNKNETGVIQYEPDCSSHTFDLLALHALYQTVNR